MAIWNEPTYQAYVTSPTSPDLLLPFSVRGEAHIHVYVNGVLQEEGDGYTRTDERSLHLNFTPEPGDIVRVERYL